MIARGPRDRDLEAPLERGARVKRRPHWLNNTVDPALAAQNRVTLTNESEPAACHVTRDVARGTHEQAAHFPAQLHEQPLERSGHTAPPAHLICTPEAARSCTRLNVRVSTGRSREQPGRQCPRARDGRRHGRRAVPADGERRPRLVRRLPCPCRVAACAEVAAWCLAAHCYYKQVMLGLPWCRGGRPRRTDSDMAAHWAPVK